MRRRSFLKSASLAVFGGTAERPAVDACYRAGLGKTIPLSIGAPLDPLASKPVKVRATVKALLDEKNPAKREAAVQIQVITLILSAYRRPYHEIVDFTKLGVDAKAATILVVKSGYLEPQIKAIANLQSEGADGRFYQSGYRPSAEEQVPRAHVPVCG